MTLIFMLHKAKNSPKKAKKFAKMCKKRWIGWQNLTQRGKQAMDKEKIQEMIDEIDSLVGDAQFTTQDLIDAFEEDAEMQETSEEIMEDLANIEAMLSMLNFKLKKE